MSIWTRLKRVTASDPPRILIYGPPGMGKTSLASEFPAPIFLQVEDGTPGDAELDTFGQLTGFADVQDALAALYQEDHAFKTIVLDSADKLEPLIWDAVCADNKWQSIEAPGYGKGYVEADYKWRDLIGGLDALRRERGMTIIIIAHSEVKRFDDPSTASYSQYNIRTHKRAQAILCDWVDCILMVNQDVQVKTEDQGFNKTRARAEGVNRMIFAEQRPAFIAKNRYGIPPKIRFEKGKGYQAIAQYFPAQFTKAAAVDDAA